MVWRNWSGEQGCVPAVAAWPRTAAEVVAQIEAAANSGRTVRVAGAGHSFNDAALTDGTWLSLDAMDAVLDADPSSGLVRVQAGIRLRALSERLAELGLALENMGDVDAQSLAGAISTGTHGTGSRLANLSAQVESIRLVDGLGRQHELSEGDELLAGRVAVGALGVITEVTLRCLPAYTLRGLDAPRPLAEVLEQLDELADGSRHFELYAFPHTDVALTRTNAIHDGPPAPPSAARRWVEDVALTNGAFGAISRTARRFPVAIPRLNRLMASTLGTRERIDRSDRVFVSPRLVRFTEIEQAFPRAAAREAVEAILDAGRRFPVSFPIEVRFVAGDEALLSPAHGRDTVYVAAHAYRGMPWEPYFRAVQAVGEEHGARPHWGKRHFHTAGTLAPLYPGWDRFQAVRAETDPDGRFANDYVRRVLG